MPKTEKRCNIDVEDSSASLCTTVRMFAIQYPPIYLPGYFRSLTVPLVYFTNLKQFVLF